MMPKYRVIVSTANYTTAATPEAAAERLLAGFLRLLPEHLRSDAWRVTSITEVTEARAEGGERTAAGGGDGVPETHRDDNA